MPKLVHTIGNQLRMAHLYTMCHFSQEIKFGGNNAPDERQSCCYTATSGGGGILGGMQSLISRHILHLQFLIADSILEDL